MYLVEYKFEIINRGGTVKFGCLELMNESEKQYALDYIEDYLKLDSIIVEVGEGDESGEIVVYLDEIKNALEEAKEISEDDSVAFKRMFGGTTYGQISWDLIEDRIYDEAIEYGDDEDEDEWEAAARECS